MKNKKLSGCEKPPLTFGQFAEIKRMYSHGATAEEIAARVDLSPELVEAVDRGECDQYFPKYKPRGLDD